MCNNEIKTILNCIQYLKNYTKKFKNVNIDKLIKANYCLIFGI